MRADTAVIHSLLGALVGKQMRDSVGRGDVLVENNRADLPMALQNLDGRGDTEFAPVLTRARSRRTRCRRSSTTDHATRREQRHKPTGEGVVLPCSSSLRGT